MARRARNTQVVNCCLTVALAVLLLLPARAGAAQPMVDGVVRTGEYDHSAVLGDGVYTLSWTVSGDIVWFGIRAMTTGWVALGLDPQIGMNRADMLFGWVSGGKATVLDQYSTGTFGPHPDDTSLGGTMDILSSAGTEQAGTTTVELSRRLVTGDTHDKPVPASGSLKLIWAIGNADGVSPHAAKGSAMIDVGAPTPVVLTFTIGSTVGTRNGARVTLDAAPVIQNGRTLLPVRYVAEPLGATVAWAAGTRTVTIQRAGLTLALVVGKATAVVNGRILPIDAADSRIVPVILQGRTMLPARFVAEQLGCAVTYDPVTRVVTVTYPKP
ncbi:MAG TPA: stalk domain-containing protein [Clostridia bacterium]|nr:stalk domain-containing protein [Clostridia bacterium]